MIPVSKLEIHCLTHDLTFHGESYIYTYIHPHSPLLFYTRVANDQNYNEFHSATMSQIAPLHAHRGEAQGWYSQL